LLKGALLLSLFVFALPQNAWSDTGEKLETAGDVLLVPIPRIPLPLDPLWELVFGYGDNDPPIKTGVVGEPISTSVGEYYFNKPLLNLGGPMPVFFQLYYASWLAKGAGLHNDPFGGDGFTHNYHISLWKQSDTTLSIFYGRGNILNFEKNGSWNMVNEEVIYQLDEDDEYYYMMDPIRALVYTFKKETAMFGRQVGVLVRMEDRNGNALTLTNSTDGIYWLLTRVEDGLGRFLDFTYINPSQTWTYPHLSTITDGNGRSIQFSYHIDLDQFTIHLGEFTDFREQTTSFTYAGPATNNVVAGVMLPAGNTPYTQTYEQHPNGWNWRAVSQSDAYSNTNNIGFNDATSETTVSESQGSSYRHTHQDERMLTEWMDQASNTATFGYDTLERRTSFTDRMGDTTTITYHTESGKIATYQDAEGYTTIYGYTAQDQTFTNPASKNTTTFTFYNLTRVDYADWTNDRFTYDAEGNIINFTNQNSKVWTFTYNARGQVLTATNPAGGVNTNTYNADSALATRTDSDTGTTRYGYDAYKRLNLITRPDDSTVQLIYNLNDRITDITDENGNTYQYFYDVNGNLFQVTDPAGSQTQYVYDLMDRVSFITDRLGKETALAYDNMERLVYVIDPNNIQTDFGYDPRGWRNSTTLGLGGQTWHTGYDNEGVAASTTTPLGHTTNFQTDRLGYTTRITDPLTNQTDIGRDAMERITDITDPLSRTTTYGYDGSGLLTGVTSPVIGTADYDRNDLGLLSRITDLNGQIWDLGYTAMGRLNSSSDPLGNTWEYDYDTRGRLSQTTYPTGETLARTYDDADNLLRRQYSDGTDLQYTYDTLDRLVTTNGINLSRDAEGRITATDNPGTVFGATFDDGGRLNTATYNNGAFTVTYTYDAVTGLLSQVTDDLTGTTIDLTYDNDRRLTGIARSNGVNTTYTWDDADRLTRIQDGTIIDIKYTLNGAGEVTSTDMTVPLDPADLFAAGTDTFTYDAASQVSSAGYGTDSRGRQNASPGNAFTWNGPSRLTGINSATLAYNGLNDLVTRTEAGITIHYYYNYAIGLNSIVAEKNDTSDQFLRYYVWTPGGRLLYMIDAEKGNAVSFHHFDATGSTIAMTDSAGAVTDSYAYTPYGTLLAHNGANAQPFTFVGQWGVRQEGDDLFHMRARYYDAVTARFVSRDPVWPVLVDAQGLNPYQYAYQNPLKYIDPQGTKTVEEMIAELEQQVEAEKEFLKYEDEDPLDEYYEGPTMVDKRCEEIVRLQKKIEELRMWGDPNAKARGLFYQQGPLPSSHNIDNSNREVSGTGKDESKTDDDQELTAEKTRALNDKKLSYTSHKPTHDWRYWRWRYWTPRKDSRRR